MSLTGYRAVALTLSIVLLAATAPAQVPVPGRQKSSTAISPIAPALTTPERAKVVTGPLGSLAADRLNTAGSTASALAPASPRWVPVTIVSRSGGRAPLVKPDDVAIVEDGVRQRALTVERWPLWLVIVLDVGRQIGPVKQLAVHRQLVYDMLYGLGEDDHVALIQYSDRVDVIQPWTQERAEAEQAVEAKFESGLDGQLWESVGYAVEHLLDGKLGHKMVVCITDGVDETSHEATFTRTLSLVRDSATTVHIVHLGRYLEEHIKREAYGVNGVLNVIKSPSYAGRRKELRNYAGRLEGASEQMELVTRESGGMLWIAEPERDPALLPKEVWRQVEGQYMVSYLPERDGAPRSTKPQREFSAFPTRGDIETRTPSRLFVPVIPPRSAKASVLQRRK